MFNRQLTVDLLKETSSSLLSSTKKTERFFTQSLSADLTAADPFVHPICMKTHDSPCIGHLHEPYSTSLIQIRQRSSRGIVEVSQSLSQAHKLGPSLQNLLEAQIQLKELRS